jgi:hypothetical protein
VNPFGLRNLGCHLIEHLIDAKDKRLAHQGDGGVIEDPRSLMPVGSEEKHRVHRGNH